jgi:hypothetical protein
MTIYKKYSWTPKYKAVKLGPVWFTRSALFGGLDYFIGEIGMKIFGAKLALTWHTKANGCTVHNGFKEAA